MPTSRTSDTATSHGAQRVDVEQALLGGSTYKGVAEQQLSEREERFELRRRTLGFFLAPATTIVLFLLPLDLPQTQHTVAAVLGGVIVAWITEPIPIPVSGMLGASILILLGVGGEDGADAVLAPFGSGTIFTFIGAFILAQSMLKHGLARRFAFRILALPGGRPEHDPRDRRVRRHHLPAVGVRLQHRDGRDAAAHRARHPHRDRQPGAGAADRERRVARGVRPDAVARRLRDHADAGVRRQRGRPADPGRQPA